MHEKGFFEWIAAAILIVALAIAALIVVNPSSSPFNSSSFGVPFEASDPIAYCAGLSLERNLDLIYKPSTNSCVVRLTDTLCSAIGGTNFFAQDSVAINGGLSCACPSDKERIFDPRGSHFCETIEKAFNPTDADFQNKVISYSQEKLATLYPSCDMSDCSDSRIVTNWSVALAITYGSPNIALKRNIHVDCSTNDIYDTTFAQLEVDVVTGAISDVSCGSYSDVVGILSQTGNPSPLFMAATSGQVQDTRIETLSARTISANLQFNTGCSLYSGIGTLTIDRLTAKIKSWDVPSEVFVLGTKVGDCSILDSTEDYVTVQCDAHCNETSRGGAGALIGISGQFADSVCIVPPIIGNIPSQILNANEYACQALGTTSISSLGYETYNSVQCVNGTLNTIEGNLTDCTLIDRNTPPVTQKRQICAINYIGGFYPTSIGTQRYGSREVFSAGEYVCASGYSNSAGKFDVIQCEAGASTPTLKVIVDDATSCTENVDRTIQPTYSGGTRTDYVPPAQPICNLSGVRVNGTSFNETYDEGNIITCTTGLIPEGGTFAGYYRTDEITCKSDGSWGNWRTGASIATISVAQQYNYRYCPAGYVPS